MSLEHYLPVERFGKRVIDRITPPTFTFCPGQPLKDVERPLAKEEESRYHQEAAEAYRIYYLEKKENNLK